MLEHTDLNSLNVVLSLPHEIEKIVQQSHHHDSESIDLVLAAF